MQSCQRLPGSFLDPLQKCMHLGNASWEGCENTRWTSGTLETYPSIL